MRHRTPWLLGRATAEGTVVLVTDAQHRYAPGVYLWPTDPRAVERAQARVDREVARCLPEWATREEE